MTTMNRYVRTFAVGPSLPASLPAVTVLLGDLLAILAFVSVGIFRHGGTPWADPTYTLETFAPLLIAWLVVAPLAGVYHRETLTDYRRAVALVAVIWTAAAVAGAAIRATPQFIGGASPTFVLVNILFGTLLLLPWRVVAVWLRRRYGR